MWIYTENDTAAVNMDHVVFIRLKGGDTGVGIMATVVTDDDLLLKVCDSGGEARDWLTALLVALNAREARDGK